MPGIAFVCNQTFTPWGGSEVLWYETALRYRKQGVEVYIYFPKWPEKTKQAITLENAGCHVTYYKFIRSFSDKILQHLQGNPDSLQHKVKSDWLKSVRPDLLVLTDLAPRGMSWMLVASEAKVKYVMISQLADETLWHSTEELGNTPELYQQAAKIFVLSSENKKAITKQLATDLNNFELIFNPFNVRYNQPFEFPELINGLFHVACVARLGIEHKRQDILLEILSDRKWRERALYLNLFGKGVHEQSLKNLARYYGLKNVAFKGHVENVGDIWAANHAFVLPSRYEGVSLAMQEALISYRMCIITKVGGVSELIRDNETGFVAPGATAELFEDAMERAWQKKENWQEMGKRAGEEVRKIIPADPVDYFIKN